LRSTISFAIVLVATLSHALPPAAEDPEKTLEAAIYRANVLGDLPGAIQQFETIAVRYAGKPVAASALLEIGQAEERLGHASRARDAYLRLVRDYPDQAPFVAHLQQHLEWTSDAARNAQSMTWVNPHSSAVPPARCCTGMAYDQATHSTVLFGGFTPRMCFGDTWLWRNGWRKLSPVTAPSARSGPGMVYDGAAGNVVLFGGIDSNGISLDDTWTWNGITWTRQFPSISPPARRFDGHGMAYHAATRKVVLFGGTEGRRALGDTWTWDGIAKTWTQPLPASSPSPRRSTMVYDEAAKALVLFGGDSGGPLFNDTYYNDTWTWDGTRWIRQFPSSSPSARGEVSIAYDPGLRSVVVFGGVGGRGRRSNDTWLWNGSNWREVHPNAAPMARCAAAMDYDPIANELVLFGGFGINTLNDTWVLIPMP
jgi:hypothetical protein